MDNFADMSPDLVPIKIINQYSNPCANMQHTTLRIGCRGIR